MRFYLSFLLLPIVFLCSCHAAGPKNHDLYSLDDTINYKLTKNSEGGGVFARMETYTNREDTSRTYVKVFSYTQKLAAVQFYKGSKKDGPTVTFNENGGRQLGTYYRNDTAIDIHSFN